MTRRVLHVLSQRPGLTGSGVTLDALVRQAARAGWEQRVVCGVPAAEPAPRVGGLDGDHVLPLTFASSEGAPSAALDFPVPGMSDVMPYPSTRFRDLTTERLRAYSEAWRDHLRAVIDAFEPQVIHSHHAWIVSAQLADLRSAIPVVLHGHGTDLRQLSLCPHLASAVTSGCRQSDAIVVLHDEHARDYARAYGLRRSDCHVVGGGYDDAAFHARTRPADPGRTLLYAGKLSRAKGVDCLLDAFVRVIESFPDARLDIAGSGSGPEATELLARARALGPHVVCHDRLDQTALGALMRRSAIFVLPSFYEGLGLVLVEALACGCRLVASALSTLAPIAACAGDDLASVPLPRLRNVDEPDPRDRPDYVERLAEALGAALAAGPSAADAAALERRLEPFTWRAVFQRVEAVWNAVLGGRCSVKE